MRKPFTFLGGAVLLVILFFSSCQNFDDVGNVDDVNWSGEFALPLAHGVISLQDMLDETDDLFFLEVDPDGSMRVTFEGDPVSKYSTELLGTLPDFPVAIPQNSISLPFPNFGSMSVNKIGLKEGTLSFTINSQHTEDVDVLITIPSLKRNGVAFSASMKVVYQGSTPTTGAIDPISLAGYELDIPNGDIQLEYTATIGGQDTQVAMILGEAKNWTYETIEGNWETERFELSRDSIEIDVYDSWIGGDVYFVDPKLNLTIENSFGFPMKAIVKSVLVRTIDNRLIPLESSLLTQGVTLNYPALNEQGQSKLTTFSFDRTNSNIDEILNSGPTSIVYVVDAVLNPDGVSTPGFLDDQSGISVTLDAEIPIYGAANNFTVESSSEVDIDDLDKVESAEFKLTTDNGIPADLDIQIYFESATGQIIDSLFAIPHNLIQAASVNSNGDAVSNGRQTDYIDISPSRVKLLEEAENLLIHASFSTYNDGQEAVRILSTQELDVQLGLKIKTE